MVAGIKTITPHPIVQICWVVGDLESAAMQWVNTLAAGPFFFSHHIQFDELTYRGEPATLDQSSAVGQWGTIQVELFQQHCGSPSGARDMFQSGQTGIHHLTYFAGAFDAEARRMESMGFPPVMTCRLPDVGGMRLAWFDTRPVLGTMIEVYEERDLMRQAYHIVAKAAEGWQGEDPLR